MTYQAGSYDFPPDWLCIKTIEMHTGGEPVRVILDGFPSISGENVLAKRGFIKANYDHLRTALMFEPRGHADMYGLIVTTSQHADFGVVFMHNEGYSTMCGHATIAITKLAVEAGWVQVTEPETRVEIEAPCGIITAYASVKNGKVGDVRFLNVPSFVVAVNQKVVVPGLGEVKYDLAYGGAFYACADAEALGISCTPENYQQLIQAGVAIKQAVVNAPLKISHPLHSDLSFLYGTILIGGPVTPGIDSRNVCIFAEGEVDRSPTGSGVSARMAIHHYKNELAVGKPMRIESILGTTFDCKIVDIVDYEGINSIVPEVRGKAYITGKSEFVIDPNDPLQTGFLLR